jgi:uncharacterized lipoprotein YmbA
MRATTYRGADFLWVLLAVLPMVVAGCGTSKSSQLYLLRPLQASEVGVPTTADKVALSVLIGPVNLPAYLDRTQVVTLAGDHELVSDEFIRWAEPLQENFSRVLVENLSLLLNTPEVYAFGRRGSTPVEFQIIIDVTRFDTDAKGGAYLTAFWRVVGKDSKAPSIKRKSVLHAAASSAGITPILEAQNRTLTEFSRELAKAIQSLPR